MNSTDSTSITTTTQTVSGEMFTESMSDIQTVTYPNTNFFGYDLGYDKVNNNLIKGKTYNNAYYNGNISGTVWKAANDRKVRKYDFSYDKSNRLIQANFGQYSSGGFSKLKVNYSVENLKYDYNGNIIAMNQYGIKSGTTSSLIDKLSYNYITGSNKILNVVDDANDPNTTLGDFHYSGTKAATSVDYSYDANGNMVSDANRKISLIKYNYLNLPESITVLNKGTVLFFYDAFGNKLQKKTIEGTKTTVTNYIGNSVYRNDTLQFFGTNEGRSRPVGNIFVYDYFIEDYLGNIRMVISDDYNINSPILEANSYYPYGLTMRAISLYASKNIHNFYKFGGKEEQNLEFVDGSGLDLYDFKSRYYDAQIGVWRSQDLKSEKMRRFSPYSFAFDNPLRFIDPDGMAPKDWIKYKTKNGNEYYTYVDGVSNQNQTTDWGKKNGHSDAEYVGKEVDMPVIYESGSDGEPSGAPQHVHLNSDGTTTIIEDPANQSISEDSKANNEPSPTENTATVIGLTTNPLEQAVDRGERALSNAANNAANGTEEAAQLVGTAKQAGALGKVLKTTGLVADAVSIAIDGAKAYNTPTKGNLLKVAVDIIGTGTAFIPGVGWGISLGIGIADVLWGDYLYDWVDNK